MKPRRIYEAGELLAGKFRVVRLLGVGGMGAVYEVMHERLKQRRALKVLHIDRVGRRLVLGAVAPVVLGLESEGLSVPDEGERDSLVGVLGKRTHSGRTRWHDEAPAVAQHDQQRIDEVSKRYQE